MIHTLCSVYLCPLEGSRTRTYKYQSQYGALQNTWNKIAHQMSCDKFDQNPGICSKILSSPHVDRQGRSARPRNPRIWTSNMTKDSPDMKLGRTSRNIFSHSARYVAHVLHTPNSLSPNTNVQLTFGSLRH